MKITSIWVKDFGPFQELKIDLLPGRLDDRADVVLITGPNGSGKTSLLMALSAALIGTAAEIVDRWRDVSATILEFDAQPSGGLWLGGQTTEFPDFFRQKLDQTNRSRDGYAHFGVFGVLDQPENPRVNHPTFVYGASRTTIKSPPQSMTSDQARALDQAGNFLHSVQPGAFEQWVAETKIKHALALSDGDQVNAARYAESLAVIERAITELTGSHFTLKVLREPTIAVVATTHGIDIPLHELPDGLRSSLAWIGDLMRRLHLFANGSGVDPRKMEFFCLIDEIDVHLHPEWQRSILHIAERLFPNAQLFVTTHSPYVIQSATDACVVRLGHKGKLLGVDGPQSGRSIRSVSEEILGIDASYSIDLETRLTAFDHLKAQVLMGTASFELLDAEANKLAAEGGDLDRAMRVSIEETKRKLASH